MIIDKQQKKAGHDMEKTKDIVKIMITDYIKVALANVDNYDKENNVIDDYVAADVYIAMARNIWARDNWKDTDNMIDKILKENNIYQTTIRRVA